MIKLSKKTLGLSIAGLVAITALGSCVGGSPTPSAGDIEDALEVMYLEKLDMTSADIDVSEVKCAPFDNVDKRGQYTNPAANCRFKVEIELETDSAKYKHKTYKTQREKTSKMDLDYIDGEWVVIGGVFNPAKLDKEL
ncbi:hypothetical protein [Vibrio lentus]|uniref:hypothetical protein n=1 Tax=Vibrio lentus TaxID=136468 RepID=UPI000C83C647|nr:hypothetical protein [Vibrio lentus]PMH90624.1 hypothetical protein BCU56_16595 [Vibrio lentus]